MPGREQWKKGETQVFLTSKPSAYCLSFPQLWTNGIPLPEDCKTLNLTAGASWEKIWFYVSIFPILEFQHHFIYFFSQRRALINGVCLAVVVSYIYKYLSFNSFLLWFYPKAWQSLKLYELWVIQSVTFPVCSARQGVEAGKMWWVGEGLEYLWPTEMMF